MNIIIPSIESIINFSKKKEILLIYFSGNFWNNILKHYEEPTPYCINICFRLREVFIKYNSLINILFKDKKEEEIKNDINKYLEEDKFASILDQSIMIIIQKDRKLSDSQILEYISYNPYYKEEKYKNKRTINLFDYIKLENINEEFITLFKSFNFEIIFDEIEFLNKMISKINNIFKFGVIINLIDINRLSNKDEYISQLKKKYEITSKKEIDSLKGEKLQEAAAIISHFITILFILEKNCEFLESMIEKMNKIISCLIYNKLIIICQCDEYQPIREFIFKKYLNDNNANNIISLINSLPKEVKIKFLNELMEKSKFTSEEFYSNSESKKIKLLCKLNNEGILDKKICYEAIWDIKDILNNIHEDIENWYIKKQTLELFLKNEKDVVINRLALIKISIENYNPKVAYDKITKKFEEINYNIKELTFMKDTLSIFHRQKYLKEINVIKEIIDRLENDAIKNYNDEMREKINKFKCLKATCEIVNQVKDFLLFKVIYNEISRKDEEDRFNMGIAKLNKIKNILNNSYTAYGNNFLNLLHRNFDRNLAEIVYEKNKKIFDKTKIFLNADESKIELFIAQMIKYFNIEEKNDLIKDLTIIFLSKKFEMDLKSIIFFFESFNKNDKEWNQTLSKDYETLSQLKFRELKEKLIYLKNKGIYDYYKKKNYYLKVFTSLYEKREAIEFLLSKINKDIKYLYDRINPINQTIITIKNIQDFDDCKKIFKKFKNFYNNFKLYDYIKNNLNDEKIIKSFESYSKNYYYIIELDKNDNSWFNLFDIANEIIQNSNFIINQDKEDFCYGRFLLWKK